MCLSPMRELISHSIFFFNEFVWFIMIDIYGFDGYYFFSSLSFINYMRGLCFLIVDTAVIIASNPKISQIIRIYLIRIVLIFKLYSFYLCY